MCRILKKISCRNQKDLGMGDRMKLLANKVHIQGMEVLLADKVYKQEPQRVTIHFTHATIPT